MRKNRFSGYLLLLLSLCFIILIPPKKVHKLRANLASKTHKLRNLYISKDMKIAELEDKILSLKEINASLKNQLDHHLLTQDELSETNVARVIFRDPAFWSSSLLIDKGMADDAFNIEKNSVVLSQGNLIGVVEEVFETFSKVRLITDKNLQFSVKKLSSSHEQKIKEEELELGTMCGISSIDNRYRFKDLEGHFFSSNFQTGDVLITSGLDGVFPEGLKVAIVTEVKIEEEEVIFPFKAQVCAPDLKNLKAVTILSPIRIRQ
jgi:rod shape-determining protein MreC